MIPESIVIDGTRQRERFLVVVDGLNVFLQPICFRFFTIFGIQLLLGEDDGWVRSSALYRPNEIVARYIYRMKENIHGASIQFQSWQVVENDRHRRGSYRLIAKTDSVTINFDNLYEFGDHDLEQMLDKLMSLRVKT